MNIVQISDKIHPLPEPTKALIVDKFREVVLSKGKIILKAGKVERNIYFIKKV